MAKYNPNRPNWPGAFQNVLIAGMQKGWTLAILLCGFGLAIWLSTPDEQKIELLKSVESFWICRAGWVVSFVVIIISGKIFFRQQVMYKSEIKRLCAERDKSQKRLGIEIESSDE